MLELLATVDPFDAILGCLWLFAAGMFPVGVMLGSTCSACCGCPTCDGSTCCGGEYPRAVGVCCQNVWRMPTDAGVCCDGVWYATGTPGECCGGVWRTEPGECCGGVWFPAAAPCPEGQVYLEFQDSIFLCCGCFPETIYDPRNGGSTRPRAELLDDLCCPGCYYPGGSPVLPYRNSDGLYVGCVSRCCVDGSCTNMTAYDCAAAGGTSLPGCCEVQGCPKPCCTEDSDGVVQCEIRDSGLCVSPSVVGTGTCADKLGCVGECCVDGVSIGQTTQTACDAAGGIWGGLGSTTCQGNGNCRPPFTTGCCETKESSAAGLTFTQPRRKRTPPFSDTLRVTVTGYTDSAILIHGTPFGETATPSKRCPINHTFLLCWDEFHVEPVPCGTNFRKVSLTVCWEQEDTPTETLNFSGCNGLTITLGYCPYACVTTLVYAGTGHTSNSNLVLRGNAVIEANGTGALVLTSNITVNGSCVDKLTLTGTSTAANEVRVIQNSELNVVDVEKRGGGLWRVTGPSSYTGSTRVLDGTLVVAGNAPSNANGSLGSSVGLQPVIGDPAAMAGAATLLVEGGFYVDRSLTVAQRPAGSSHVVILGATGSGTATIGGSGASVWLGGPVTLQAANAATANFAAGWLNSAGGASPGPAVTITVGSPGNAGTVVIGSALPGTITSVSIVNGTLRPTIAEAINYENPVTIGSASTPGTLDLSAADQSVSNLSFAGNASSVIGGTLLAYNTGNPATVNVSGTGHEISSSFQLDDDATFDVAASSLLAISGVVADGFAGAKALAKTGSGTLTLSAANTYTGGTTVNAGILRALHVDAFGTGDIVVNAGGTLDKNGYAIANTITNNGGTVLN